MNSYQIEYQLPSGGLYITSVEEQRNQVDRQLRLVQQREAALEQVTTLLPYWERAEIYKAKAHYWRLVAWGAVLMTVFILWQGKH